MTGLLALENITSPDTTINGVSFSLSYFDDFTSSLDIVGPSTPAGKYFPSRPYGSSPGPALGIRVIATDVAYNTDPLHTGFLDQNRGVAVGSNNIRQSASVLTLQARKATAGEITSFSNAGINNSSAQNVNGIVHTAGAVGFYPGTDAAIYIEARIRFNPSGGAPPRGYNAAYWTLSSAPVELNGTADENDIVEYLPSAGTIQFANHTWAGGSFSGGLGTVGNYSTTSFRDGNFHTFGFFAVNHSTTGPINTYIDGTQIFSGVANANTTSKPQFLILSNFIDGGTGFVQGDWTASGTSNTSGAYMEVDYIKIYRQYGLPHFTPQTSVSNLNLAYNGTGSVVLPSKLALWGDSTVTEYIQCIPAEENEPGGSPSSGYVQFPSFVTYNSTTRTLSVDFSGGTGGSGRLHVAVYAYKATGATFVPLRFAINRAPIITTTQPSGNVGVAYSHDFYFDCDVGIITPKIISITGLPSGLTFDGVSAVSGTPVSAATTTVSISCTNNLGQVTSTTFPLVINP